MNYSEVFTKSFHVSLLVLCALLIVLSGCGKDEQEASFTDARDGQTYKIVTIGDQVWMAENLNYDPTAGSSWCYDDIQGLCDIRGRLYNHSSAPLACPDGWHLPSFQEWNDLSQFLGGNLVSGGKLKASGTEHWYPPNIGATNESGFGAQPFGRRRSTSFEDYGEAGYWWTSSFFGIASFHYGAMLEYSNDELLLRDFHDGDGLCIRCIKD